MRSRVVAVVKFENELTKKKIYIAKIKNKNKIFKKYLNIICLFLLLLFLIPNQFWLKFTLKSINNIQSNNMVI